ncbi:acyl-CoA N-acyltransferase [Pilaira anomala]|nr:acyl-CoA N-acyltransferase [Pilaira anomala]
MVKYTNLFIKRATTPEEREQALKIRISVFVEEQDFTIETEIDGNDDICQHWVAYCDKETESGAIEKQVPVGTIRLYPQPGQIAKLSRFAVIPEARGLKIGQELVKTLIQYCKENNYPTIVLSSKVPKSGFYAKMGFAVEEGDSDTFDEDGFPHIRMWMRNLC